MASDDSIEFKGKKILFAPLNWGLGHATRSAVLIDQFRKENEILIASDGTALQWLESRYPDIPTTVLPSYSIAYDSKFMWWNMLRGLPKISGAIKKEHDVIQKIVKEEGIDLVVSDHRLGCYIDLCKCVVIAHQLVIPHSNSTLSKLATAINKRYLNKYDEVWIPDTQNRLSGNLSNPSGLTNTKEIGPLSLMNKSCPQEEGNDILILLSGPEPSRTQLEELLCQSIIKINNQSKVLVRGTNEKRLIDQKLYKQFNQVIDMADSKLVNHLLEHSKHIICRSGYSTIMDLDALHRSAILIPTPCQPEQEYLAKKHEDYGHIYIPQKEVVDRLCNVLQAEATVSLTNGTIR